MILRRLLPVLMVLLPYGAIAQKSLPDSKRESEYTYAYKVGPDIMHKIFVKGENPGEDILGNAVAEYKTRGDMPRLPRGNYLLVNAEVNDLVYNTHTVDDLEYTIVEGDRIILYLTQYDGSVIEDATARVDGRRMKFDRRTKTYTYAVDCKGRYLVEIDHDGVMHYVSVDVSTSNLGLLERAWRGFKSVFGPGEKKPTPTTVGMGYMVFSKPRYRPGETVRMKAFVTDRKGKPVNIPLELRLKGGYGPSQTDTVLVSLKPYRPGAYTYDFRLSDSLKMYLDNRYTLQLEKKTSKKKKNVDVETKEFASQKQLQRYADKIYTKPEVYQTGRFSYEDYELEKITFSVRSSKRNYNKGEPVEIFLSAADENGMAAFDGQATIEVRADVEIYHRKEAFVPNILWEHTVQITDAAEKKVVLPDSIFPEGVSLDCQVRCTYLNADNEKHDAWAYMYYDAGEYKIVYSNSSKGLRIEQLQGSKQVEARASLKGFNLKGDIIVDETVMLPTTIIPAQNVSHYAVRSDDAAATFYMNRYTGAPLNYSFHRDGDSIKLDVLNPFGYNFRYSIYRNGRLIDSGHTDELAYRRYDPDRGNDNYTARIGYIFAGWESGWSRSIISKPMEIGINMPSTVYPGQKAEVEIEVADSRGRAIEGADITAYAVTSKFRDSQQHVPYFGKSASGKLKKDIDAISTTKKIDNYRGKMTWERWSREMGLDTVEYYRFLHPNDVYYYRSELTNGREAQVEPYVVIDGEVQGVHILYIDNLPRYVKQAGQLDVYSFVVGPGLHNIRLRTHDREVTIDSVMLAAGYKTILSVDGSRSYRAAEKGPGNLRPGVKVRDLSGKKGKDKGMLSKLEMEMLRRCMITVENTFDLKQIRFEGYNVQPWELPQNRHYTYRQTEAPYFIDASNTYYFLNPSVGGNAARMNFNPGKKVLVGPFSYVRPASQLFKESKHINSFTPEGGYEYTLAEGYQKIRSWDTNLLSPRIEQFVPEQNFHQNALTPHQIDTMHMRQIFDVVRNGNTPLLARRPRSTQAEYNKLPHYNLRVEYGKMADGKTPIKPLLITFVKESATIAYVFPGSMTRFNLHDNAYRMILTMEDASVYVMDSVRLKENGENYLKIDSITTYKVSEQTSTKKILENFITTQSKFRIPGSESQVRVPIQTVVEEPGRGNKNEVSGKVLDTYGQPIIGATVMLEGAVNVGSGTDVNGNFTIKLPERKGSMFLIASSVGKKEERVRIKYGRHYTIVMEDQTRVEGVVVQATFSIAKESFTGDARVISADEIRYAGGGNLLQAIAKVDPDFRIAKNIEVGYNPTMVGYRAATDGMGPSPMIILNGLPFDGKYDDIDPASIVSHRRILPEEAVKIYGGQGSDGVLIITTNDTGGVFGPGEGMQLRRNFSDDAFWQPTLRTDKNGKASFEVIYPDDITKWNTNFLVMASKKRSGQVQASVRSFKALNAQLALPRFAIEGDSINVIGRLSNYMEDTVALKREITVDSITSEEQVVMARSHVDSIPATAAMDSDSMTVRYTITGGNGYFDGEQRTIPVYMQGVMETHGQFAVINGDTTQSYLFDSDKGKVTVHAETSGFDMWMREIAKLDDYPYLCNEQMASKIKALLAKQKLSEVFGTTFGDREKIESYIQKLLDNSNGSKLWGWWGNSNTELWISRQVVGALLAAQKAGYRVSLDIHTITNVLTADLMRVAADYDMARHNKNAMIEDMMILTELGASFPYDKYLSIIDTMKSNTLNDNLRIMLVRASAGLEIDGKQLMSNSARTMMGSMYWRDKKLEAALPRYYYYIPYLGDTQNTLLAYRILRLKGGHEEELERIRNYFMEQRKSGSWVNTYESSSILETIMPDMVHGGRFEEAVIEVNGVRIDKFPYTGVFDATAVTVKKTGTAPVFFTAHQQSHNRTPQAESKGFTVKSYFQEQDRSMGIVPLGGHAAGQGSEDNPDSGSMHYLSAGKPVTLVVEVDIESDCEYVMIEVPIPAGCSYESKWQRSWTETHREHYKDRVSIFCNRLVKRDKPQTFTIELIPRFTGLYNFNPAKAELMYFPTFYGRENQKMVTITTVKE